MTLTVFNATQLDYEQANCKGIPTELFMEYEHFQSARRVCEGCPLNTAADCYFEAVRDGLTGTWGGVFFGKPGAGVRNHKKGATERMKLYRAVLCERLDMTVDQFIARYGKSQVGIKNALRSLR